MAVDSEVQPLSRFLHHGDADTIDNIDDENCIPEPVSARQHGSM